MMLALPAQITTTALTTAGLAVGIGLLTVEHVRWWRGGGGGAAAAAGGGTGKDPKALIPFWFGMAFGTLAVACPAGLLGTAAGVLRWGGNGVGGWIMHAMTGQSATTVAHASAPALDGYGALVVTCLVIALWLLRKQFAKVVKGKWWRGVWAGTLLAIGTGAFALVGDLVVPGANSLGQWAIGGLVNGTIL